jgi:hypothetical protein
MDAPIKEGKNGGQRMDASDPARYKAKTALLGAETRAHTIVKLHAFSRLSRY